MGILILAFCLFISDAGQNAVASILSKNMPISEESKESFENWNGFQQKLRKWPSISLGNDFECGQVLNKSSASPEQVWLNQ